MTRTDSPSARPVARPLSVAGRPRTLSGPFPPRSHRAAPGGGPAGAPERLLYSTAPPDVPRTRALFYGLFVVLFVAFTSGLGVFVVRWNTPTSVALFSVVSLLLLGAAYGIARQVVALSTRRRALAELPEVPAGRRVALLYTTMNDVVPECLEAIRQTYPSDVYVLDDSSDPRARATVDSIAGERGYTVVRRTERRGFKAGAVNDWYLEHRDRYDYLVLLDSDSFLPPDWVAESLRFAEHPENRRVAVFQGLINIWNYDTRFVQTLAPMSRAGQFVWEEHLANAVDAVFCYGHNCLMRTEALEEIGGFVEGYVSEDFATAVALADRGWHSRFIPLHSYEAMPENVRGFIKRQNKWTRGAMEFIELSRRSSIPVSRKFHLWQTPFGHVTNLLLPVGMFLAVYGYASSPGAAWALLKAILGNPVTTLWGISLFRYLLVLGVLGAIPEVAILRRCGIGAGTYWRHRWLSAAVAAIELPYEVRSMLTYLAKGLRTIPVTPKGEAPLGARDVLFLARYSLVIDGALLAGLAFVNPVGAIFNAMWLAPMLLAPLVILRFSGPIPLARPAVAPNTGAHGASWSLVPRVASVHALLLEIRDPRPAAPPALGARSTGGSADRDRAPPEPVSTPA